MLVIPHLLKNVPILVLQGPHVAPVRSCRRGGGFDSLGARSRVGSRRPGSRGGSFHRFNQAVGVFVFKNLPRDVFLVVGIMGPPLRILPHIHVPAHGRSRQTQNQRHEQGNRSLRKSHVTPRRPVSGAPPNSEASRFHGCEARRSLKVSAPPDSLVSYVMMGEAHGKRGPPLAGGSEIRRIPEHFGKGSLRQNDARPGFGRDLKNTAFP